MRNIEKSIWMKKKKQYLLLSVALLNMVIIPTVGSAPIVAKADTNSTAKTSSKGITVIDGQSYASNFTANGSATISGNTATLTPDTYTVKGNTVLNTKIDMNSSFELVGRVNIGSRSQANGGADGLSFVFQPGDTDVIGNTGGAMGFGGVEGAFGFKLDTYYNEHSSTGFTPDPPQYENNSFGAFVDGTSGVANTIVEGSAIISDPSNNEFKDITINYNGSTKMMTVIYEGHTFSQNVSSMLGDNESMSFAINASTGLSKNMHQFELGTFTYTPALGQVKARYVYQNGIDIISPIIQTGEIGSKWTTEEKSFPGYELVKVTGSQSGAFTANDQNVIYEYAPVAKGNVTINYIDDTTGKTLETVPLEGQVGDKVNYSTASKITEYENKNYVLVSDGYPKSSITFTEGTQTYDVHFKHKTETVTTNTKKVKQTIHYLYYYGSQASPDVTETLIFTEKSEKDLVTGVQSNPVWSAPDSFDQKISPEISGYAPDKPVVAEVTGVTHESSDIEETVTYKKVQTTGNNYITYIDDDTKKQLHRDTLTGELGTTATYSSKESIEEYEAMGYELVKDGAPTEVTFETSSTFYEVHLKHRVSTVSETTDVNQVIHYVYENGSKAANDVTDKVSFTMTGQKDHVTNIITNEKWTNTGTTFSEKISPVLSGYTADKLSIAKVTGLTQNSKNIEETVTYTRNLGGVTVKYIDDTTNKQLASDVVTGTTGDTVDYSTASTINYYEGLNYELVEDNYPTSEIKFTEQPQEYTVHLKHKTESVVTDSNPVNQVIHYVYENKTVAAPDKKDQVIFTQTGTKDLVTGEITNLKWTNTGTSFSQKESPVISGYTPDKASIAKVTGLTQNSKDIEEVVTYYRNQGGVTVKYIDDDATDSSKSDLHIESLKGDTGQNVAYTTEAQIKSFESLGYILVSDGYPTAGTSFTDEAQTYEVHLKHGTQSKVVGEKDVNQTIHYIYADGTTANPDVTDKVTFVGTGTEDLVTGKVTNVNWVSQNNITSFSKKTSPTIKDYTPDMAEVAEVTGLTKDSKDMVTTVTYLRNQGYAEIDYIDDVTREIVGHRYIDKETGYEVKYTPDEDIKFAQANGYEVVSKPESGTQIILTDTPQHFEVHLTHLMIEDSEVKNSERIITQTIHYLYSDTHLKAADPVNDSVTFTQFGTYDSVTEEYTDTYWTNTGTHFDEKVSPTISLYTPDKTKVSEITGLTQDSPNYEETVLYTRNQGKVTVNYIDDDADSTSGTSSILDSENSSGDTETNVNYSTSAKIKEFEAKGYLLVSDNYPTDATYQDKDQTYEVHLKHKMTDYVNDVSTVNHTIKYIYDDKSVASMPKNRKIIFEHNWVRDEVTQEVTDKGWSSDTTKFDEVISPLIPEYTADQPVVASVADVNHDSDDIEVIVTYTHNIGYAKVTYIDDTTGKNLEVKDLQGLTTTTSDYSSELASKIEAYQDMGYVLESNDYPMNTDVTFNDKLQEYEVHFTHGTKSVITDKKTVNQVIHYVYEDGTTASNDVTDSIEFVKNGTQDLVTGDITDEHWTSQTTTFSAKKSPIISGYTADIDQVEELKDINHSSEDHEVTVVYSKDKTTADTGKGSSDNDSSKNLPQTGDSNSWLSVLIGTLFLSISLGFINLKRNRKSDE